MFLQTLPQTQYYGNKQAYIQQKHADIDARLRAKAAEKNSHTVQVRTDV